MIDSGEIKDARTAQAAAGARGCSKSEITDAVKYHQEDGVAGGVKVTGIRGIIKDFDKDMKGEDVVALTNLVIDDLKRLAPGKPVTQEDVQQRVAVYMAKGSAPGKWAAKTAFFSAKAGTLDGWAPDVNTDEETQLRSELVGVFKRKPEEIGLDAVRAYKKQKMGLRLGAAQEALAPKKAPKATAAAPDTAPSARGSIAIQASDRILNKSGAN